MAEPVDLKLFFNFRSPYCYLASKAMFEVFDAFHVRVLWRPLGGWNGRSPPERAAGKIPSVRQDVGRWSRRLGIPYTPPPPTTDPTNAALGSLAAERKGVLRPYIVEVMREEWGNGQDIGDMAVLTRAAARAGLSAADLTEAVADPAGLEILAAHAAEAKAANVFGVPSFLVGDQIFWGNDRLDFLAEHLTELRLAKL